MNKELKELEKEMEEKYPLYIKDYNGEIRKVSKERANQPPKSEQWIKEFEKLQTFSAETAVKGVWTFTVDIAEVKQFITSLLKTQKAEILERIQKIGAKSGGTYPVGFWEDIKKEIDF